MISLSFSSKNNIKKDNNKKEICCVVRHYMWIYRLNTIQLNPNQIQKLSRRSSLSLSPKASTCNSVRVIFNVPRGPCSRPI